TDQDGSSTELGVKFRSDLAGTITGIRFYKGSTNTGTHVGELFSLAGALLASATFTNETASGWQQVTFATPVTIQANTTYVAAYPSVTTTFSESLQAAPTFTLKDAGNNPVAGTVTYSDATHTATFTPSAALNPSTTYTATVSGAKDRAGNVMTSPLSWSFTT